MRRLAPLAAIVVLAVGCSDGVPGGKVATPTPDTVIGKLPTQPSLKGDPAAGKAVFASAGCGACHTYAPAGTKGKVGPDLDKLATYFQQANQGGTLAQFIQASIVTPGAYVAPGYQNIMPATFGQSLKPQQIADLVAFLAPSS